MQVLAWSGSSVHYCRPNLRCRQPSQRAELDVLSSYNPTPRYTGNCMQKLSAVVRLMHLLPTSTVEGALLDSTQIACFRAKSPAVLNNPNPVLPYTVFNTADRSEPFVAGKIIPIEPLTAGSQVPFLAGSSSLPHPHTPTPTDHNQQAP